MRSFAVPQFDAGPLRFIHRKSKKKQSGENKGFSAFASMACTHDRPRAALPAFAEMACALAWPFRGPSRGAVCVLERLGAPARALASLMGLWSLCT